MEQEKEEGEGKEEEENEEGEGKEEEEKEGGGAPLSAAGGRRSMQVCGRRKN